MSQWKLSALFYSRAGGLPVVSFKPSVNIFRVFSLESWLGQNQWCIWFHFVSSSAPCFINEGGFHCLTGIFLCALVAFQSSEGCIVGNGETGRNLSSGIWVQLRQVTWNNSRAFVDGMWNFIVNKKRGEVTWSNRPSHLWKSQDRVTKLPVQFLLGSVWGWSCWKPSPGRSGGHSVIASSANTELSTQRVSKLSVRGNKRLQWEIQSCVSVLAWQGLEQM